MAAAEIRRAILGRIPDGLRNCVNKEYLMGTVGGPGGFAGDSGVNGGGASVGGGGGGGGYNFNPLGVPHSTTLEPVGGPNSGLGAPSSHSTPHSTLDGPNHLGSNAESSEVH